LSFTLNDRMTTPVNETGATQKCLAFEPQLGKTAIVPERFLRYHPAVRPGSGVSMLDVMRQRYSESARFDPVHQVMHEEERQ
jgi:hypothetical protein